MSDKAINREQLMEFSPLALNLIKHKLLYAEKMTKDETNKPLLSAIIDDVQALEALVRGNQGT